MPKKEVKVTWYTKELSLNQIYQITQMQFAFLSSPKDGSKQCHPFVLCRDYLHDAVRCCYNKSDCNIYGFAYKYGVNPLVDLHYTRMLVTRKDMSETEAKKFDNQMVLALRILHNYEEMAGWRKSRLLKIDGTNVWLFVGSNIWMKSPFLVSMFTFLIRLSDKYDVLKDFTDNDDLKNKLKLISEMSNTDFSHNDNDVNYTKHLWNKLDVVIQNRDQLFFSKGKPDSAYLDSKVGINSFHNYSGILSLCKFQTPYTDTNTVAKQVLK